VRGLTIILAAAAATLLGGCTHWTELGQGGAAEDLPQVAVVDDSDADIESVRELQQDFDHSRQHLEVLILRGAKRCFPASVHAAGLKVNRVAREIAGGLLGDAEASLLDLRIDLHRLERKIEALSNDGFCSAQNPDYTPRAAAVESTVAVESATDVDLSGLAQLLNSDNQFAHGSHLINPKYRENLAAACALLKPEPGIRLIVTGHADASGNSEQNSLLSSRRAMTVADYLITCGIDSSRIQLFFEGDSNPRYDGRAAEIDLVNRRVAIRLEAVQQQVAP